MRKLFYLLFFMWVLVPSGCAQKVDLGPGYQRISKRFLQGLRWQDYRGAAAFLQSEHRQQMVESFAAHKEDLHIVDAEYLTSDLDRKAGRATSELVLKYYLLPSTQVREWTWKIDWVLIPVDSEQRGTWQVQGALPAFP